MIDEANGGDGLGRWDPECRRYFYERDSIATVVYQRVLAVVVGTASGARDWFAFVCFINQNGLGVPGVSSIICTRHPMS